MFALHGERADRVLPLDQAAADDDEAAFNRDRRILVAPAVPLTRVLITGAARARARPAGTRRPETRERACGARAPAHPDAALSIEGKSSHLYVDSLKTLKVV